ncbi:ABC transporter substrate-binding protein [Demequina salsinemoris]|uniref:ABC transporter substrate-binding protein n=1 Tax=Demequina salsinemoris TaxID=577470 RepID=UPI000783C6CA
MEETMARKHFIIGAASLAVLALAGCSGDADATDGSSASGSAEAAGGVDAATATSLADFGSMEELEAAAIAEGELNVIALPHDWANYGEIIDAFKEKYPEITVNEAQPDGSSADEIAAAEDLAGQDTAPDVFDLGLAVALSSLDQFAPYQVAGWDDIDDSLKESTGLYVGDYGGYMAVGYDPDAVPAVTSLEDLLGEAYKGSVAINGDPTQAGAAFAAVGLATLQNGGSLDDFQSGVDFFEELSAAGNFLQVDVTSALIASGEVPVDFDWDYLQAANKAAMEGERNWEIVVLPDFGYASYYNQAVNVDAPHPAAARLWEEFLYSDEVQNLWLAGGARPVRAEAMSEAGTLDQDLWDALPEVPAETFVPTAEQSDAAATLLGDKWAAAVS